MISNLDGCVDEGGLVYARRGGQTDNAGVIRAVHDDICVGEEMGGTISEERNPPPYHKHEYN